MRCDQFLTRAPESIAPDDPVQLAAVRMREANIGFLPVCDAERTVVGVLTDRDLAVRLVAEGKPATTPVRELMTEEDLVACRPDDDLEEVGRLMREHGVARVLVTDEQDHLVGVVSLADVVRQLGDDESVDAMRDVTEREAAGPPA